MLKEKHLMKMIESWKPKARPEIIDQQIILALEESDEHLNPDGWEKTLEAAHRRRFERNKTKRQI